MLTGAAGKGGGSMLFGLGEQPAVKGKGGGGGEAINNVCGFDARALTRSGRALRGHRPPLYGISDPEMMD